MPRNADFIKQRIIRLNLYYANYTDEMKAKEILVSNAADRMDKADEHYGNIRGSLKELLGEWSDNIDEIANGTDVTIKVFVGTIISAAVTASSGGSLAPAAYAAVLAGLSGSNDRKSAQIQIMLPLLR